jgi:hypothetical protein
MPSLTLIRHRLRGPQLRGHFLRELRLLAAAALLAASLPAQEPSANLQFPPPPRDGALIHGRVIDAAGEPVFGVEVITSRMDAPPGVALTIGRAVSRSDGYFHLTGLNAGTYILCVDPQGKPFLDPCEWSPQPLTVQLEENGIIHDIDLPLEAADLVTIEVEDPTDALGKLAATSAESTPQSALAGTAGNLLLGLRTRTGALSPARLAATDKQSKKLRYIVPAPKATDLDVLAMPINLELRDKANTPLANRGSVVRVTKEAKAQKPQEEPIISLKLAKKGQ